MKRSLLGGVAGVVLLGLANSAHAIVLTGDEPVIDDFTTFAIVDTSPATAGIPDALTQPAPVGGAIGQRSISIDSDSGGSRLEITGLGYADFSAGIFDSPVYHLTYGAADAALNVELPGRAFVFDVLDTDLDDGEFVSFTTTLTSGLGIVEDLTIELSEIGQYIVPFWRFENTDFSDIDIISFTLDTNGIDGVDLAIGPIVDPVPEPATLALFGFGLLGLGGAMRQRKA